MAKITAHDEDQIFDFLVSVLAPQLGQNSVTTGVRGGA
jgi:hypothetical protein